MKKLFALFLTMGLIFGAGVSTVAAQNDTTAATVVQEDAEDQGIHYVVKEKFIEGDPIWMTPVLLCLIFGLAVAIERIITLSLSEWRVATGGWICQFPVHRQAGSPNPGPALHPARGLIPGHW